MYPIVLAFIALGSLLVYYFLRHDHGRKLPVESLWVAFAFGIGGIVLAVFLESLLLPVEDLLRSQSVDLGKGFATFMGVGFIEEIVKFLPLALYIYKKPYFKERTDGVIYFAICGLTFGLLENIMYTTTLGTQAGLIRLLMTPFLHAATTGIIGYYLASYKIDKANIEKFIIACFAIPFIHGMYDFLLYTKSLHLVVIAMMTTLLLSISMFLYFHHANELDGRKLAYARVEPQNFCSACGQQNARHGMFCEKCGRRL